MEQILINTSWIAVILSTIAAFGIGSFWYSPKVFGTKWRNGIGQPAVQTKIYMFYGMLAQLFSTLFLAFIISGTILLGSIWATVVVAIMLMGFIKAHGFYAGKTKTAITIEVGYIFTMFIVIYLVQMIWY